MTIYKVLNEDGSCRNNGVGSWPLPVKNADGTWTPGEWLEVEGPLVLCENGLHGCDGEAQLLEWIGQAIFEMEYAGERIDGDDKFCTRRARLLRKLETWNDRTARVFACDCAERVLHIFETERPDDKRPRNAIDVSRRYAEGQATKEELDAARAAAMDAVCAAESPVAWAAARVATWAATRVTVWAAARVATGDAVWAAAWATRYVASAAARAAEIQ